MTSFRMFCRGFMLGGGVDSLTLATFGVIEDDNGLVRYIPGGLWSVTSVVSNQPSSFSGLHLACWDFISNIWVTHLHLFVPIKTLAVTWFFDLQEIMCRAKDRLDNILQSHLLSAWKSNT
ncbi:hypothetical protein B0O80DRAFT_92799 [Mortierella sp. GBAus27b]|nr:hypothetical protein B0O80DRAFT_92799 [Mortierella sp. GBAus27b]